MFFKSQLEKRDEQQQSALQGVIAKLASALGADLRIRQKRDSDGYAILDLLYALGIKDCNIEENDFETPQEQMERILSARNIMQMRVLLSDNWWLHTIGPILGYDKDERFVALLPNRWSKGYYFINSKGERVKINGKVMREQLQEDAISFYSALPAKKLTCKDLVSFVLKKVQSSDIIKLLAISLVISLFGLFTPFINKQIFDNIIPNANNSALIPIAGLLIGAGVGGILFGVIRDLLLAKVNDIVNLNVQPAVMARTFSLRAIFFSKYSTGDLSNRITSINRLCELMNDTMLSTSLTLLFSFIYIAQMTIYAKALLLPAICILLVQILLMGCTFWVQNSYHNFIMGATSKINGLSFNIFNGIQKIKLTGSETRGFVRWMEEFIPTIDINRYPMLLKLYPSISATIQLCGTALLYFFAMKNNLTTSDYIAFSAAYGLVNGALMSMAAVIPSLAQINPLLTLAAPIMEQEPEIEKEATPVTFLSGAIEVNNLCFRYSSDTPPVIEGLNLKVKPGEYIGIVGKSGCGKSTLLKLLLGFEKPQMGSIYYDDYDLQKVNKQSLRQHIGTCLQNGSLFPGNLYSNITITAPQCSIEDAWEAARLANIDKDIEELPMGMHTLIVEGGGGFSGGQKQRLLIARALLNKPSILFFDEATSALDNISQQQVSENLDKLGCTRVIIAHRFSTIRNCSRIIVLDKGNIAEEGSFNELMEKRGLFYEMSKRQM